MARDNALVGSSWLSRIHPRLGVPVWALIANSFVIFVIGCVYLGSTTAFNAMIGTGLILQQISYAFPAALIMCRKRSKIFLPTNRHFELGIFGWFTNFATLAFAIIVIIFFNFPTVMPAEPGNMNYVCVVLGAMAIFAIANWFLYAKKRYEGPRLMDDLRMNNI